MPSEASRFPIHCVRMGFRTASPVGSKLVENTEDTANLSLGLRHHILVCKKAPSFTWDMQLRTFSFFSLGTIHMCYLGSGSSFIIQSQILNLDQSE